MTNEHDPGHSFEAEVLSKLSELSTGQLYVKESVDGINEHLKALNGSVRDLYDKHATIQLNVANRDAGYGLRIADLSAQIDALDAASEKKGRARHALVSRWSHWLIILTSSSLAAIVSSLIIRLLLH